MKNFDWTQFTLDIAINSSMESLYDAWAVSSELERWFLSDAKYFDLSGSPLTKTEQATAGHSYEWQWHLWDVTEGGKITSANGKDHIQFTFADNCLVDINLKEFQDGVIVTLKQSNIPTDDESKKNVRLGCHTGWSFYMVNMKSIYEGGIDLRNKNTRLKPMVNN